MRNYDEETHNSSHDSDDSMETPAKHLFAQLDKDGDGYLLNYLILYIIILILEFPVYYYLFVASFSLFQVFVKCGIVTYYWKTSSFWTLLCKTTSRLHNITGINFAWMLRGELLFLNASFVGKIISGSVNVTGLLVQYGVFSNLWLLIWYLFLVLLWQDNSWTCFFFLFVNFVNFLLR